MWSHKEEKHEPHSRVGQTCPWPALPYGVNREQGWDGVWGKGCECCSNVPGSARPCTQTISDRVVCCGSCHSTCSHPYKTLRTLGCIVPCSHCWNPPHHLLNCHFFLPGRWAVFTDCEHQGLLLFKHEGSCHLHLPHVLLLCILGSKRNCVWRKLHGGKNLPTEGKATSKLPARHNNLHKFLSEVHCTP